MRSDGTIKFIRRTGRPRKVRVRPEPAVVNYAAEVDRERQAFVQSETATYESEPDGLARVWRLLRAVAEEIASMKFDRRILELEDRAGAEKVSSRVTEGYVRLASLLLELRKLGGGAETLDMRNPKVQLVVREFNDQLEAAARETLGERAEVFLSRYQSLSAGWEDRV